ncbi:extensin family protein [Brucella sp. 21LCYQ03]|nr:extensin family protein [Brucella sp. 21LCYQ03]
MAISFACPQRVLIIGALAAAVILLPGESLTQAQAQNFIERVLSGNAKQAQVQKRSTKKRTARKAQHKTSPVISAVPIPTPAPRREEGKEPVEAKPAPSQTETAPLPENKPEEQVEITKPEIAKPEPQKPERVYQVSCPALMTGDVEGKLLPPIEDGSQCSARSPLSLTAIGKVEPLKFTNAVTTNCAMAVTLAQWSSDVKEAAKTVYGNDIKIAEIGTGSDYQCRNVNGASEGRVSEHAFANALDIMSFKFSDGSKTELESGWNGSEKEKKFWRAVHGASCKLFMTVIGPDGDAAHLTNMHLDQGCHSKSCLARICQ